MSSFVEVRTGDGGGGGGVQRKKASEVQGEGASVVKGSVGWMNRSEVRKRVYAGMTPGEKRAKHIITGKVSNCREEPGSQQMTGM